jgi:hypothetical protein
MDMACVPTVRDATCRTAGCFVPAILYMVGIISMSPWEDV